MEQTLARFAAMLVSPVVGAAVVSLAFTLRRPWRVRSGSAAVGPVKAFSGLLPSIHPPSGLLGLVPAALAASPLQAELRRFYLLPT